MRLGLFGGTFDPPHNGHLFMAERAREAARLDRVVFIPCRQSPHKTETAPTDSGHRLRMLELAAANLPWAGISRWEMDRGDALSYSWITARHFADAHPDADLHWILGGDQWRVLETWRKPERLADLVTFIVVAREGALRPKPGYRAVFINDTCAISATQVRETLAAGGKIDSLIPTPVARYIHRHSLYR